MLVLDVLRALAGAVLLAWLPGYAWTRVLLPELSRLERFVYSVALSVVLVVLFLYLGNVVFGMRVSPVNGVWGALAITAAGFATPLARTLLARLDRRVS